MPQSMPGPGSHVAPADQTTEPDGSGADSADAQELIRSLGVSAGDRLDGRYRLERVLHLTGPAVTWIATDEKLNRPTRIHTLRSDQPRAEAFMAAARAAAAMPDNHFVQVLDAVPDDGLYYVITEWLNDGHTLGEVIGRGPMPVPEAVRITQELARAMAEAHENGLAHLRLSPKTVLRTDTGEVKILDLCLAAALTGTVSRDPLGTDLTAIGELAYAMLTGTRPQADPVAPSEFRSEVPPQLDEVVLRTLGAASAGEPYQTPTDVAEALAQLPRPRYEPALPSTPQTAPLRHQQTTVMPVNPGRPPAAPQQAPSGYPPAPTRAEARTEAHSLVSETSHGSRSSRAAHGGSGGGHRARAYDDDYVSSGGGDNRNVKVGIAAVAAVAAIALVAYFSMSGGGSGKGNSSASSSSPTIGKSSSATAAVGTPVSYSSVAIYDSDDGSEGSGGVVGGKLGPHGWSTRQYCQNYATSSGKPKAGTGLLFDLGSAKQISAADVTIGTAGAAMEMWVADPSVTSAPALAKGQAPAGFTKVASATADSTDVALKAGSPVTSQFVLIWFTKPLPAVPAPDKTFTCAHDDGSRYGDTISAVNFES